MNRAALDVLEARGFVQQVTDAAAVRALFAGETVSAYIGFDPTAESLHVGNLFSLMALRHVQEAGHRPVVVLGGGTAMVGDPSGRTQLRQMLSADQIRANLSKISQQIGRILDVAGGRAIIVDNAEWLCRLNYIDFLRDIGRHFSVNRMLAAEAYKQRLEHGLSFVEFNYQLLQAYDFLQLRRRFDVRLQMGGDDQWGNILAGVDLCRRVDGELVHGLTTPLLTTATGAKMGKTVDGAIWLDATKLAPYDYYQYWVNVHDDDVVRLLGYYTLLPMAEIRDVARHAGAGLNAAKSVLAYEATGLLHGESEAREAHQAALGAFGGREIAADILPSSQIVRATHGDADSIPTASLARDCFSDGGLLVLDALVHMGLAGSKAEARRLIQQGAVRIDDRKVGDVFERVSLDELRGGPVVFRVGKKKVHRLALG